MIEAASFIHAARARGFLLYTGVPCSYLTPFINHVLNESARPAGAGADAGLRYIGAANEGDAVAIGAGAELGGMSAVVMFQNSGLGNAVNPLTSLTWTFRLPVLLIVTWRGEPGGAADEPQHELMGEITPRMIETMGIPWADFPVTADDIAPALDRACAWMREQQRPYAFIMHKGSVADTRLDAAVTGIPGVSPATSRKLPALATRREMLGALQKALGADDLVIATTGFTGRELYALDDRPSQLYMVGSMGCAMSFGLGLAVARPDRRVVVIDGDGALLMRMGALTTIGHERPPNLLHLLFDNGMHESTGGQATVAPDVDFCAVAAASGYPRVSVVNEAGELGASVADRSPGLRFVHVPLRPGVSKNLPRPTSAPYEVAARFRRHLGARGGTGR